MVAPTKAVCTPRVIPACTAAGVHAAAAAALVPLVAPPARVLDCGTGHGAFAARLLEDGYTVEAVDVQDGSFQAEGVPFHKMDLNGDFSHVLTSGFDAICALEVIEHLENPRHFLRQCRKLLNPNGVVLLTTPNVEIIPSRLKFLASGRLLLFDEDPAFNDPTHITPIFTLMFDRMVRDTGFVQISRSQAPRVPPWRLGARGVTRLVSLLLYPFVRGAKTGTVHVILLRPATGAVEEVPPWQ